ncbi:MAG: hypothetical protein RI531_08650, partial [Haloferacaceae archaeon]|nr:hypothetical protein [Haloferacaceae archaeon]
MASQSQPVEVRLPNKIKELSSVEYCVWMPEGWNLKVAINRGDDRADPQRDQLSEALVRNGPFTFNREESQVTDYIY